MKKITYAIVFIFLLLGSVSAKSSDNNEEEKGPSGLPLPRFASLKADKVNLRTGPGTRYPIEWVYVRERLPVEITAEYDVWRRVRDWEGSEGWLHKSALTGQRTGIITGGYQNLLDNADENAKTVAIVEQGAIGQIKSCHELWCEIKFGDIEGYIPKNHFWGTYSNEDFD